MFRIVTGRILWGSLLRVSAFWVILGAVGYGTYDRLAPLGGVEVAAIVTEAFHGHIERVSTQDFAFSLATAIGAAAAALFVAYLFLHAVLVSSAVYAGRRVISKIRDKIQFAEDYDRIHQVLSRHPLLGHAWKEFDETVVREADVVRNTLRPQTFFNYAMLRERLVGLKLMSGIPGYFVGIGLLLTFIGLVIALSKAAAGTQAAQDAVNGAGAVAMQAALRDLLQAATFKFSTSIAGLAASIVLSFFFRIYVVMIEASLGAFCEALEEMLDFVAPQSVTLKMSAHLEAQLTELKAINSGEFFARLGQEVGPRIHEAMHGAINPLADKIGDAVGQLSANSQSGMHDLIQRFSDSIQGSAGAEMRELGISLQSMHGVLEKMRIDMAGSGEDFAKRMTEAAENLNRLVADAGRNLGEQSDRSRETLEQMMGSLREVLAQANHKIEENLTGAAEGASGRLEQAMDRVLGRLEGQVGALHDSFGSFRETATGYVDETSRKVAEAQAASVAGITTASANAAAALEQGLSQAMGVIRGEVETFASALRTSSTSLGAQTEALDRVATRSREAAEVFGRSSEAVRSAVDPITRSNEKIAAATETVGRAIAGSVTALGEGQKASTALSEQLTQQVSRLTTLWAEYQKRFEKVDEALGRAFEKLATESQKQALMLADHTTKIDKGLSKAVDGLAQHVENIGSGAEELSEAVEELKKVLVGRGAVK